MPDRDRNERGAFFPDNSAVQALEGVDDEDQDMCSNSPRERGIDGKGQCAAEQIREIGWPVTKDVYSSVSSDTRIGASMRTYPMRLIALASWH